MRNRPGREPKRPLTEQEKRQFEADYEQAKTEVIAEQVAQDPLLDKATQKAIAAKMRRSEKWMRKMRQLCNE